MMVHVVEHCTENILQRTLYREHGTESTVQQWHTQIFFLGGCSTNSVEDRGQREQGSGGGSPLVRGSTQFANG
jgi:hypothetical protein